MLLERKAKKIRAELEIDTNQDPKILGFYHHQPITSVTTVYGSKGRTWRAIFAKALIRPFVLFVQEPIIQVMGLYMVFVYGMLYCESRLSVAATTLITKIVFLTTIPTTFKNVYGQSLGISGLNYIAMGLGIAIASQVCMAYAILEDHTHFRCPAKCKHHESDLRWTSDCNSYTG